MTALQQDLFTEPEDETTRAWREFSRKNPFILGKIIRMVEAAKDRGESEVSILTLLGLVRKDVSRTDKPIAMNNNWAPIIGRQIQEERKDLAHMIKTRRRTSL